MRRRLEEVKADAAVGTEAGVNSTPAFFINGKRIPGGGCRRSISTHVIELELKKAK